MKDNISLIAAAAGGFMLSIAIAGIIKGVPVISLNAQPSLNSTPVADLRLCALERESGIGGCG